jgi:membrane-associated phospholipid phosphatase
MPNMKRFQLSQMHIVTVVIGGFVIGLGSGYALWKYLRNLFLRTVPVTRLRAAPA